LFSQDGFVLTAASVSVLACWACS